MFASRYMPCSRCGASVERAEQVVHECSLERLLDFKMFAIRDEVTSLQDGLLDYLDSPAGRFEIWDAARQVRGSRTE